MRSLFWRILASFWLAIALVAGLSILLGHMLNKDAWILSRHPGIAKLAQNWTQLYEDKGQETAQEYLQQRKRRYHVDVQVLNESGEALVRGTFPPRAAAFEARQHNDPEQLPWRRLTSEYTSPKSGETYLFIYRIPHPELNAWHRKSLIWPLSALGIALVVLTLFSLMVTLSITRPLSRLRGAVHDLGQTTYQQNSLAQLANRRDEFGVLATDFNRMGARLQALIGSQRQLLRDVSHELRSPLARLRIALALAERAEPAEREKLWPRLARECDRLEALISEILVLARLDADFGEAEPVDLAEMLHHLQSDALLGAADQQVRVDVQNDVELQGWPDMLERALDNLLRNALRFNPAGKTIEFLAQRDGDRLLISVRDHGPGVSSEFLPQLGEPFYRAPGQTAPGYGLGLAIAKRAAERHGGNLTLANHPEGGFVASMDLPLDPIVSSAA
ncbi:HAMP domain-containing sensor histidine kinase [Pseudomonas sp. CCI3.2]|uniref:sensor histidine kinase n=1 Tax=unclassified Pseudomonas TaxID=196821 RepID=UPI002AC8BF86|nr:MULTISPECIES: HAMP domain-containing sensor histidine kinase [unclassified Pseudomonas]MEB0079109.1 HAMP domain-containing sensor histidine kinase [Pseudomonas sp. MH10out]MEB0092084.1 HAMP domain-containing sensor histidine kinase [Pseudomonas sp. CCI4.2]MEB0100491.1 HAMP domain-containing sensor histidine kinase [Pseudomonas sp. CCI3.2]MEB0132359.1 HAMP domain-containing sensor histidine kinase [Pseudomonas sp. CCI2.4]MEB0158722.1 HAMP domain-containing sensor histidine kinase [Pseudomona